jgi:hypothetical protein
MRAAPPQLSQSEWDDLVDLIVASPTERIDHALERLGAQQPTGRRPADPLNATCRHLTPEGWLLHLASISSGSAFDRALLAELRRLSLH